MCYDIKAKKRVIQKMAQIRGKNLELDSIIPETNLPLYHASCFIHPKLPIITKDNMIVGTLGLASFLGKG